jgi:hypothetical protein
MLKYSQIFARRPLMIMIDKSCRSIITLSVGSSEFRLTRSFFSVPSLFGSFPQTPTDPPSLAPISPLAMPEKTPEKTSHVETTTVPRSDSSSTSSDSEPEVPRKDAAVGGTKHAAQTEQEVEKSRMEDKRLVSKMDRVLIPFLTLLFLSTSYRFLVRRAAC